MLESRGSIPPATLAPPGNANEIVGDALEESTTTTPTASDANIQLSDFPEFPEVKAEIIVYKVQKGDSFWKIAKMYGVGMKELAAHNNMDLKKHLKTGKTLEIPPGGKLKSKEELAAVTQKTVKKASHETANTKGGVYTVKPGDSLWLIGRMHGTTVQKLTEANGINKNTPLKVGQKLILPAGSKAVKNIDRRAQLTNKPKKEASLSKKDNDLLDNLIDDVKETGHEPKSSPLNISTDNYLPHTIKEGDTWTTVSEMYGVSVANLKKANPKIASEQEPAIGSVINIPEE
jgi:LysM repeat protein